MKPLSQCCHCFPTCIYILPHIHIFEVLTVSWLPLAKQDLKCRPFPSMSWIVFFPVHEWNNKNQFTNYYSLYYLMFHNWNNIHNNKIDTNICQNSSIEVGITNKDHYHLTRSDYEFMHKSNLRSELHTINTLQALQINVTMHCYTPPSQAHLAQNQMGCLSSKHLQPSVLPWAVCPSSLSNVP